MNLIYKTNFFKHKLMKKKKKYHNYKSLKKSVHAPEGQNIVFMEEIRDV